MNIGRFCLLLATAILACAPSTSRGITLGQIDTFEANSASGWVAPGFQQILTGGPGGASDHYLMSFPEGSGPNIELTFDNRIQWSGNYLAADVTGIEMDLMNPSSRAMQVRVAFRNPAALDTNNSYGTTAAFTVPPDSQWHHATFSLTADSMTAGPTAPPFATYQANVPDLSIFDSINTVFPNSGLTGFGIDNVHAIPEPASISILISGIIGIALLRRNRARC
jgi:hypothetical protein